MSKMYVWGLLNLSRAKNFAQTLLTNLRDARGATAVEYALIVGLIAVVIIAAISFLGGSIRDIFNRVGSSVSSAR